MATIVELSVVRGLILDNATEGLLDTAELGGENYTDITPFVRDVSVKRGKNRELDKFSAGSLNVRLNNNSRTFDPKYSAGPYYGDIIPRRPVRVTTDGVVQFTGVVEDWNLDYRPGGESRAELVGTDDLTYLARQELTNGTATAQTSGARVQAVLDMASVAWPNTTSIDTGSSVLGADVYGAGNALDYLRTVERSEQGALFVGKDGTLQFKARTSATARSTSLVTFADDATGIDYTRVDVNYGTELMFNTVDVTSSVVAGTATATNPTAQEVYGVTTTHIETLVSTAAQMVNIADYTVRKYADPEYRIGGLTVNLDSLGTADKATVLGLEISDVVLVKFTPNGMGDPITQYGQVIRLSSTIAPDRHDIVIGMTSLDWNFLVLDDAVFGILDTNALAF